MISLRRLILIPGLFVGLPAFFPALAEAAIALPSDIAVTLAVSPSTQLVPGQPFVATISVTNNGPVTVPVFELLSSKYTDEFDLNVGSNDCGMGQEIVDGDVSYSMAFWDVYALGVGETRICHWTLALSPYAAQSTLFSFGLAYFHTDPKSPNDMGFAYLKQANSAIPALSNISLVLLTTFLIGIAGAAARPPYNLLRFRDLLDKFRKSMR
jgi:hypothetical protein